MAVAQDLQISCKTEWYARPTDETGVPTIKVTRTNQDVVAELT